MAGSGCSTRWPRWSVTAFCLACSRTRAEAAPVDPTARLELAQPDGSTVVARGYGDEWLHGLETVDGYTIVRDETSGYWEYAQQQPDGTLAPSGLRPGVDRPVGLRRGARDAVPCEAADDAREANRTSLPLPERRPRAGGLTAAAAPAVGTHRSLVILAQFQDEVATTTPASGAQRFFGAADSVRDYYDEVSYGAADDRARAPRAAARPTTASSAG